MNAESQSAEDDFYARALERIEQFMAVLGIAALLTAWVLLGWRVGLGFAFGGVVAYVNFHWL
jgi:hypothetical protein